MKLKKLAIGAGGAGVDHTYSCRGNHRKYS